MSIIAVSTLAGPTVLERTDRHGRLREDQPIGEPGPPPGSAAAPPPKRKAGRLRRWLVRNVARWARRLALLAVVITVAAGARRLGIGSIATVALATVSGLAVASWHRRRFVRRRHPLRLVALAVVLTMIGSISWSYTGYAIAPGAATTSVRTSDWMRDHGLSPVVDRLEQFLYSRDKPSNGPVLASQLPASVRTKHGRVTRVALASPSPSTTAPTPVGGLIDQSLTGEGQWTGNARKVSGAPVTYTTFFRPDRSKTDVVAAAVWLDPATTKLTYVPGTKEPRGTSWAWGSGIPQAQRPGLVAAFNGGFKFKDTVSGVFTEGLTPRRLVDGQASLALYADGHAAIGSWGNEMHMSPGVVTVRQNLQLIVDGGHPVSGLRTSRAGQWGARRWLAQYTNRSGIGITDHGALVYVAGANLTTESLADALARAGSVRAMELDIHASNPTFNFFHPAPGTAAGVTGSKLLPKMGSAADRFLAPDQRDFFAVTLARTAQP